MSTLPDPNEDHRAFCAAVFAALRESGHKLDTPVHEAVETLLRARISVKFGYADEAEDRILRAIALLCEGGAK